MCLIEEMLRLFLFLLFFSLSTFLPVAEGQSTISVTRTKPNYHNVSELQAQIIGKYTSASTGLVTGGKTYDGSQLGFDGLGLVSLTANSFASVAFPFLADITAIAITGSVLTPSDNYASSFSLRVSNTTSTTYFGTISTTLTTGADVVYLVFNPPIRAYYFQLTNFVSWSGYSYFGLRMEVFVTDSSFSAVDVTSRYSVNRVTPTDAAFSSLGVGDVPGTVSASSPTYQTSTIRQVGLSGTGWVGVPGASLLTFSLPFVMNISAMAVGSSSTYGGVAAASFVLTYIDGFSNVKPIGRVATTMASINDLIYVYFTPPITALSITVQDIVAIGNDYTSLRTEFYTPSASNLPLSVGLAAPSLRNYMDFMLGTLGDYISSASAGLTTTEDMTAVDTFNLGFVSAVATMSATLTFPSPVSISVLAVAGPVNYASSNLAPISFAFAYTTTQGSPAVAFGRLQSTGATSTTTSFIQFTPPITVKSFTVSNFNTINGMTSGYVGFRLAVYVPSSYVPPSTFIRLQPYEVTAPAFGSNGMGPAAAYMTGSTPYTTYVPTNGFVNGTSGFVTSTSNSFCKITFPMPIVLEAIAIQGAVDATILPVSFVISYSKGIRGQEIVVLSRFYPTYAKTANDITYFRLATPVTVRWLKFQDFTAPKAATQVGIRLEVYTQTVLPMQLSSANPTFPLFDTLGFGSASSYMESSQAYTALGNYRADSGNGFMGATIAAHVGIQFPVLMSVQAISLSSISTVASSFAPKSMKVYYGTDQSDISNPGFAYPAFKTSIDQTFLFFTVPIRAKWILLSGLTSTDSASNYVGLKTAFYANVLAAPSPVYLGAFPTEPLFSDAGFGDLDLFTTTSISTNPLLSNASYRPVIDSQYGFATNLVGSFARVDFPQKFVIHTIALQGSDIPGSSAASIVSITTDTNPTGFNVSTGLTTNSDIAYITFSPPLYATSVRLNPRQTITTGSVVGMRLGVFGRLLAPRNVTNLPGYDIIVVGGQSNAVVSLGTADAVLDAVSPGVFMYDSVNSAIVPSRPSLTLTDNWLSVGSPFANAYATESLSAGRNVLLVQTGVPSTEIARWVPGQDLFERAIGLVTNAIALASIGTNASVVKGFLWVQGEADGTLNTNRSWYRHFLDHTIEGFRHTLPVAAQTPFGLGMPVGVYYPSTSAGESIFYRDTDTTPLVPRPAIVPGTLGSVIWETQLRLNGTCVISSEGLPGDGLHYYASEVRSNGMRLYGCYKRMIDAITRPPAAPTLSYYTTSQGYLNVSINSTASQNFAFYVNATKFLVWPTEYVVVPSSYYSGLSASSVSVNGESAMAYLAPIPLTIAPVTPTTATPTTATPTTATPTTATPTTTTPTTATPTTTTPTTATPTTITPTTATPTTATPTTALATTATPTTATPTTITPTTATPTTATPTTALLTTEIASASPSTTATATTVTPSSAAATTSTATVVPTTTQTATTESATTSAAAVTSSAAPTVVITSSAAPTSAATTAPPASTAAPTTTAPVATTPVATTPVATTPVATAPVATTPVATTPVATTPVATTPVATTPVATTPVATTRTPTGLATTPPAASVTSVSIQFRLQVQDTNGWQDAARLETVRNALASSLGVPASRVSNVRVSSTPLTLSVNHMHMMSAGTLYVGFTLLQVNATSNTSATAVAANFQQQVTDANSTLSTTFSQVLNATTDVTYTPQLVTATVPPTTAAPSTNAPTTATPSTATPTTASPTTSVPSTTAMPITFTAPPNIDTALSMSFEFKMHVASVTAWTSDVRVAVMKDFLATSFDIETRLITNLRIATAASLARVRHRVMAVGDLYVSFSIADTSSTGYATSLELYQVIMSQILDPDSPLQRKLTAIGAVILSSYSPRVTIASQTQTSTSTISSSGSVENPWTSTTGIAMMAILSFLGFLGIGFLLACCCKREWAKEIWEDIMRRWNNGYFQNAGM
jgi:hypothetical protein